MKANSIEYEIEKIKSDIKIQELQTNKMKSTILSQNCSFNNIDSLMLSKIKKNMNVNRSIEVQSQYTYTYKEKNWYESMKEEKEANTNRYLEQRMRSNDPDAFHNSDLNKTSAYDTTQYASSHIFTKNSEECGMLQSFTQKALIEEDYDEEESKEVSGSLVKSKSKRHKGSSSIWANNWIIM